MCQNEGQCFQDDRECPKRSICLCQSCSTSGFNLSYRIKIESKWTINKHTHKFVVNNCSCFVWFLDNDYASKKLDLISKSFVNNIVNINIC